MQATFSSSPTDYSNIKLSWREVQPKIAHKLYSGRSIPIGVNIALFFRRSCPQGLCSTSATRHDSPQLLLCHPALSVSSETRRQIMAVDKPGAPKRKKPKESNALKPRSTINRNKSKKLNSKNPNFVPLGENKFIGGIKQKDKEEKRTTKKALEDSKVETVILSALPAAQQLGFFLDRFQSASKSKLSPLELETYKDSCMVELSEDINQDEDSISKHIKDVFGESWKEVLCDGKISEATIEPGSPTVLIICGSASKSLELLRGLKVYTQKCRPAKLFAKHMKVEEQVELLRSPVNIASGTPSRIKKLVDLDALLLSRLAVIVLDMRVDVKGYSLLTLPQVSSDFWGLYRTHLNERVIEGSARICFYGPTELRNSKKTSRDF